MLNLQTKTVREIALEMPQTTRVFEEYKIDYCCHGNRPFDEACRTVGADPADVMNKIGAVMEVKEDAETSSLNHASLTELIDYILDKHHTYTKQELVQLPPLMQKVSSRHGSHYPYILELKEVFQRVCDDLHPHLMKEEAVLFPFIKNLETNLAHGSLASVPPFGTVNNPIRMMRMEHDEVGSLLAEMRKLSNDYTLPDGACPSFTALYSRMETFERDLHRHIHLENNLLFPKAIELETKALAVGV